MNKETHDEWCRLYDDSPEVIGDWGEIITATSLRNDLSLSVVRSVYLPYAGEVAQVDMVAVGPTGVYVIENKNYHGVVLGSVTDKYWRVFYSGVKGHSLYSPVYQNRKHREIAVKLLEEVGHGSVPVYSPVIFNDFSVLRIKGGDRSVYTLGDFVDRYKSAELPEILSKEQIEELTSFFSRYRNESPDFKALHKAMIDYNRHCI